MSRSLAERAVACGGFRWMPRMRDIDGATCCTVLDGQPWLWFVDDCVTEHDGEDCFPDLDDPATLGCIEHGLLPELFGTTSVSLSPDGVTWAVFVDGEKVSEAYTKPEALVAALEAGHE